MKENGALCVAGMHRSGTSLIANWLAACGLVIADRRVVAPAPDNPLGFGEDMEFLVLHARSIRRRQRFTSGWRIAPSRPLEFSPQEIKQAQRLLDARQEKYSLWGWKDPRTTLFLPQWKALLPGLKTLIPWRPCDEVVFSLLRRFMQTRTKRLAIDPVTAVRLWRAYNRLACDYAQAHPQDTLVLPLQPLVQADEAALACINRQFHTTLIYRPLASLFRPQNLNQQGTPKLLTHFCRLLGCGHEENRLQALSTALHNDREVKTREGETATLTS